VTSDHGASTILQPVDVPQVLHTHGFAEALQSRALVVARGGGASLIYLQEGYKDKSEEVVNFLQKQEWIGPLFTATPLPGTLPLSLIGNANHRAADILFSLRWTGQETVGTLPGGIASDEAYPAGKGMHGSFSPFEMHNFLVVAGPDFKKGRVSTVPSGSIDLVPTILTLLDVPVPPDLDGRLLTETLADGIAPEEVCFEKKIVISEPAPPFRSVVQLSEVKGVRYFDKGLVLGD
jgi:arylsulfatase A-like enzyme